MLEKYTAVKSGEQGRYAQEFNATCVKVNCNLAQTYM